MECRTAISYKFHRDRDENSQECVCGFSMNNNFEFAKIRES